LNPGGRGALRITNLRKFYRTRDLTALGIANGEVMFDNAIAIHAKREAALDAGFYLEAISLMAHELEWFLMLWIAQFETVASARKPLGGWISRAETHGFEPDLVARLRTFSNARGRAVHRLLRGEIRYEDLRADVIDADRKLLLNVMTRVIEDIQGRTPYFG
jgi:hypothetical protein